MTYFFSCLNMCFEKKEVDQPWSSLKDEIVNKCKENLEKNPNNRGCKYAVEYLASPEGSQLSDEGTFHVLIQRMVSSSSETYFFI